MCVFLCLLAQLCLVSYYNISKRLHFPSLLLYFSIFVEESFSIPSIIERNKVYRIAAIFWLLTAVVLTNLYNSHVISELNSPLKGAQLTSIDDLYGSSTNVTLRKISSIYYLNKGRITQTFSFDSNERLASVRSIPRRKSSSSGFTFLSDAIKQPYVEDVWTVNGRRCKLLICKRRICKTCPVCKTKIKMFYFASVTLNFKQTLLSELQKLSVILHGTVQCPPTTNCEAKLRLLHCHFTVMQVHTYKRLSKMHGTESVGKLVESESA